MTPLQIAASRLPAILLTLALEMFVGLVISSYRDFIRVHIVITSFFPVLASIAGNIGLQSSTATLRALSTGHASVSDVHSVIVLLFKEFLAAASISTGAALLLFVISSSWAESGWFGLATGLAIFFNGTLAGILGSVGPVVFKTLEIDPAFMAGPFETAIQDLLGTSIYLAFAVSILPLIPPVV